MKRKFIGVIVALLLGSVGTFALISYVQSAKERAVADERLVEVYVLAETVPEGTPVGTLKQSLKTVEVPARVRVDDTVRDVEGLDDDLVTGAELQAGEQLLASRLVDGDDVTANDVPHGLQAVTVALAPERAVGGGLRAGDTVGVVLSFDPFDVSNASVDPTSPSPDDNTGEASDGDDSGDSDKTPNVTHLTFHKVLVTSVQFDQNESAALGTSEASRGEADGQAAERAPSNELLVTLAVSSPQVEQIVFAAEFGHIWLTAENADADEAGTRTVTFGDVYDETGERR